MMHYQQLDPAARALRLTCLTAPGDDNNESIQGGEQTWIAYHAWEVLAGGRRGERRFLYLDKLDWVDGKPVVRGPTMM